MSYLPHIIFFFSKGLGLFRDIKNNSLALTELAKTVRYTGIKLEKRPIHDHRELFQPHFEIWSDASCTGFGAYLLTHKDHRRIRWLSDTWCHHYNNKLKVRNFFFLCQSVLKSLILICQSIQISKAFIIKAQFSKINIE